METGPVSKMCSFVLTEYQMMDKVQKQRNPENYKLVLSLFLKSGTIIKIAVCYTAKKAITRHYFWVLLLCMSLGLHPFPLSPCLCLVTACGQWWALYLVS
jgi:hypothetical protein